MQTILHKLGMLIAVLLGSFTASAYDFEVDGNYYNIVSFDDMTCEVTSGDKKYSGDVVIPSEVEYNNKTLSVVSIGGEAFRKCREMTSVIIPNSVVTIGGWAFGECVSLTSVTIPNSVTAIGEWAFDECVSLTSITIPDSVISIGDGAFSSCWSLTYFTIPDSVTTIGKAVFSWCGSLFSVIIGNSVTAIGEQTFSWCSSLSSVAISDSVTEIGPYAFYNCSSLNSVTIGNSVTKISYFAFENCTCLESITIPDSVQTIEYGAFVNCTSLKHITLSNSLEEISVGMFSNCTELESLVLPGSIKYLWQNGLVDVGYNYNNYDTFRNCNNLTNLSILYSKERLYLSTNVDTKWETWTKTIKELYVNRELSNPIPVTNLEKLKLGESVRIVQIQNLNKLEKLTTIESHALVPPELPEMSNAQYINVNVYVPKEALEAYKTDSVWGKFWNLQASGVDGVKVDYKKEVIGRYDINGRAVSEDYQGLVIVRFSDGSCKKMLNR